MNRTVIDGNIVNLPELTKREQAILSYIEKREMELASVSSPSDETHARWQEAFEVRAAIYRILHSVEFSK